MDYGVRESREQKIKGYSICIRNGTSLVERLRVQGHIILSLARARAKDSKCGWDYHGKGAH